MRRRTIVGVGVVATVIALGFAIDHFVNAPHGEVDVVVRPRDARVRLDDDEVLTARTTLATGSHAFDVTRPGYALSMFSFDVAEGRSYDRAIVLRPLAPDRPPPGRAAIVLDAPTGLRGVVTLDGRRITHIPSRMHVAPGSHVVVLRVDRDEATTTLVAEADTVATVFLGQPTAQIALGLDAPEDARVDRVMADGRVVPLGTGPVETLLDRTEPTVRLRITPSGRAAQELRVSHAGKVRVGLFVSIPAQSAP